MTPLSGRVILIVFLPEDNRRERLDGLPKAPILSQRLSWYSPQNSKSSPGHYNYLSQLIN